MRNSPILSIILMLSSMVLSSPQSVADRGPEPASTLLAKSPGGERTLHRLRQGETLGSLATRYGSSVSELARLNGIRNPNRVYAGQLLIVPEPGQSLFDPTATPPGPSAAPAARAASAELEGLARVRALYLAARFAEARTQAASLAAAAILGAGERATLAFFQGTIEVAFGDFEAASRYFEAVFREDPTFDPGDALSPKIQPLIANARAKRFAHR